MFYLFGYPRRNLSLFEIFNYKGFSIIFPKILGAINMALGAI